MRYPSEAAMVFEEIRETGRVEGRIEALVDVIIRTLRRRSIELSPAQQDRLRSIKDVARLDLLVEQAHTVERAASLFPRSRKGDLRRSAG